METTIIAHSYDKDQVGGGALRLNAIIKLYNLIDINTRVVYQKGLVKKIPLKAYLFFWKYGYKQRSLFQYANLNIENSELVQLEHLKFFNWDISPSPKKIIYNAHNLEFELFFTKENNSWKKKNLINLELSRIKKADLTLLCSQREKDILVKLDSSLEDKLFVVPNMVSASDYQNSLDKKYITFFGTLDYSPNIEAVRYLLDEFQKEIPKSILSKYEFVIAGKNPSKEMESKIKDSIFTIRKNLSNEDMKELKSKTKISLVPLINGSGTRLKIIESIFSGAWVFSTPIGAEGITSKYIKECSIENFSKELIRFIESNPERFSQNDIPHELNSFDIESWTKENGQKLLAKIKSL